MKVTNIRKSWLLFILCICLAALTQVSQVHADDNLDEVLSGFDDPVEPSEEQIDDDPEGVLSGFDEPEESLALEDEKQGRVLPPWLDLSGSLTLGMSWNFAQDAPDSGKPDYRDISMLRTTGALGADIDIGAWQARISGHGFYDAAWSIQDQDMYTDRFMDLYEDELEFDDLYIAGSLTSRMDLKIGRQVVVWGKADNVRVTDILNPLNNQAPGMVDIKYRRLPVTMSRLDYYIGDWNLTGLVIHEVRFDKNPVFNSEFYPGTTPPPPEKIPTDFSLDTQQYGLALNGIFSGWDFSFYQAWVYDSRAHVTTEDGIIVQKHNKVTMTGMTGNLAWGNWLFKGEGAFWRDLEFGAIPGEDFDRIDLMAGIEYTGFSETMLSMEIVNRHIIDFDDRLTLSPDFAQEDLLQTVLMLTRDFSNDTIQLKILCSIFGAKAEDGAFERFQLEYDLSDHITLTGGVIFYQSGNQLAFSNIGNNDRIFFEYKYSF